MKYANDFYKNSKENARYPVPPYVMRPMKGTFVLLSHFAPISDL